VRSACYARGCMFGPCVVPAGTLAPRSGTRATRVAQRVCNSQSSVGQPPKKARGKKAKGKRRGFSGKSYGTPFAIASQQRIRNSESRGKRRARFYAGEGQHATRNFAWGIGSCTTHWGRGGGDRPYSGRILTVFLCILITREEYVSCPYLMCICARIFTVFFHSQTSEKNTYLSRIPN
jgi:hypothetical protein